MKWKKFTIQTTTAAEDFISEKLSEMSEWRDDRGCCDTAGVVCGITV